MDARTLAGQLDAVRARLDAGEEVPVDEVERLLAQVPRAARGPRADVVALKQAVDALQVVVQAAQQVVGDTLDEIGRGRRGNEGYRSLRAHRTSQKLYRRA